MRIPHLHWDRRHNIAALTVSYGKVWHSRETGDLILGYNATGRLARVVLLNPRRMLPREASAADAIGCVVEHLLRAGELRQLEHDVLRSALDRADRPASSA